ncbi:MAG: efflux RND transporter permease subunit [Candidatus Obscuribacterales bacterium]|nr:efflux RND transporter permease subunit [Candidatus Obscuribacterales bacterium]
MGLIRFAMGRPVTVIVLVMAVVLLSILAMTRMQIDIFPHLNLPRISVVQPYGGMDPSQMEGYMVTFYEQHFFYISGVDHVSSRSIQGASVMDIYFHPETDMADAMSQVVAQVERSRSYMPPGTVTPFIIRFDVGNVPVGYLVFSSPSRELGQIQDLVYARVRPVVSTIPGASAPPPFGGNQRSIVLTVDSARLNQYHVSIEDIVQAVDSGNVIEPSGVVRTGDLQRMSSINSVVGDIKQLLDIPIKKGPGAAIYIRDLATVQDATDITTGYALVNGNRTVYMAISKQASASTLTVVNEIKEQIAYMQSLLPEDIKVSFEFDQSIYVTEALKGLLTEGAIGALLTGGVVLLFLRDFRSSIIVVLNIPFALLAAVVGLWIGGQSINIMTLSGLSLAVGILVDEATVTIENIHSHLASGAPLKDAIWDASLEVVIPRLLAMLSVVSVFLPSFFMVGVTQSLFVPLSLAVGLAMFASYILSGTFVPVMCAWLLKAHAANGVHDKKVTWGETQHHIVMVDPTLHIDDAHRAAHAAHQNKTVRARRKLGLMEILRHKYQRLLIRLLHQKLAVIIVFVLAASSSLLIYPQLARELFPEGNPSSFQLRIKAATGTRFERTEELCKQALRIIDETVGKENVKVSIAYVGTQPTSYAISNIYMWTSGPQEAVVLVDLEEGKFDSRKVKEDLRKRFEQELKNVAISFEAGDIVNKIIQVGSPTPIQVDINGPKFSVLQAYTNKVLAAMLEMKDLRDVGIIQALDYPTINIDIDRVRAGQLDVSVKDVGRALVASTYSSRFVTPIYWRDTKSGLAYQVQVQVPQGELKSLNSVANLPIKAGSYAGPFLRDVANVSFSTTPGEFDHYNMSRMLSISANLANNDLGKIASEVSQSIDSLGKPPRGIKVSMRGQVPLMQSTFFALYLGVAFAIVAITLMLVAFFQSLRLSLIIVSVVPAILFGALVSLFISHTSLNIQSFMGAIMATGVGVANSILVVVFSEERRVGEKISAATAAVKGAAARIRPVLMTSLAMIAGMIPMALGMSEGGERTAPLGRAVIGGLLLSTPTVLLILPVIYAMVQKRANRLDASVLPDRIKGKENVW